ncbi:homoserine O-acetyltransferase [Endobacter medicaginis]|uniref:Homoserine O-acetyltransferase n=1 Tax=Endobacter medicaginis TaxID=1181271 RepID=A0A850NIY3_9PROT|nr:homoserine O-acetyltransferase [Endobacter medicaginis]MBB3172584.1 homoserine O-acetyltransferase [Endobacter medicaginis]MCX5475266.1 homoserine O-acetyltransferase [Endobacter medicaginis]NVN29593.1 homoserine O-acetyltransferase [Endobacter medicaginis]
MNVPRPAFDPAVLPAGGAAADDSHQHVRFGDGLALECGAVLDELVVAYRTYGRLDADRANAILVCHALTGDQYVAEPHPLTGKPGWWSNLVGPGLPIDTDRFFVICANVLGGCMGSTGPRSTRPDGTIWGTDFPPVTIRDMVDAQARLIDHLGIDRLFAVIGGSMGGMQVLQWAARYPERVFAALPIATAAQHSAQNIAFNEVSRQAIAADPDFHAGHYRDRGTIPARGLGVARMMAHITYLSEEALTRKFGRRLQSAPASPAAGGGAGLFGEMFEVESYLRHQGSSFVRRFDANSYLTVTRAMDYFDLARDHDGDLASAFAGTFTRFCVVSFSSDWLFPTAQSRAIARALNRAAANVSFVEIDTDKGHDAFLLDEPDMHRTVAGFLDGAAIHAGLRPAPPGVAAPGPRGKAP